jgi:hypothetical protein
LPAGIHRKEEKNMQTARAILGVTALGLAASVVTPAAGVTRGGWPDPGWTYIYEARLGQDMVANLGNFDELDGSWDDDNAFSLWFGDKITAIGDPGGVEAFVRFGLGDNEGGTCAIDAESLAVLDLGNGDPNQKIYFERFLTDGGDLGGGTPGIGSRPSFAFGSFLSTTSRPTNLSGETWAFPSRTTRTSSVSTPKTPAPMSTTKVRARCWPRPTECS